MKKKNKFIQEDLNSNNPDIYNFEKGISSKDSSKDQSEYSDHIYVGESHSKENLYDRNNPAVKVILLILGVVAVIGTVYYVLSGIGII